MDDVKRFRYIILPEHKLIVESWSGEFNMKEILNLKNMEASDPNWKDDYDVLADDRLSNKRIPFFNTNKEDNVDSYLPYSQKFIKKRKTALLVSLPEQVVTSVLLELKKPPEALVQIQVFSTLKAALLWLGVDVKELEMINGILKELATD